VPPNCALPQLARFVSDLPSLLDHCQNGVFIKAMTDTKSSEITCVANVSPNKYLHDAGKLPSGSTRHVVKKQKPSRGDRVKSLLKVFFLQIVSEASRTKAPKAADDVQ
jgi:hypothetical protein